DRAGADLQALPGALIALDCAHHEAVAAPVDEVLALADKDITERGVAGIRRTAHHHVAALDLAREEHAVAVVGQEGVFQLVEGLEILGPGDADRGAVVAVAPGDVILAVNLADAGVVAVFALGDFGVFTDKVDRLIIDLPVDAVL